LSDQIAGLQIQRVNVTVGGSHNRQLFFLTDDRIQCSAGCSACGNGLGDFFFAKTLFGKFPSQSCVLFDGGRLFDLLLARTDL
jgi:hypothetical protein